MSTPPLTHTPRFVKWLGVVVGVLLATILVAFLALEADADALRGPLSRLASRHLGRAVHIDGRLRLHLFSFEPSATVAGVHVGNPPWAGQGDTLQIESLRVNLALAPLLKAEVVIPRLEVDSATLNLLRDAQDRATWELSQQPGPKASKPTRLPILRSVRINGAHVMLNDAVRRLKFDGTLSASQGGGGATLRLDGNGQMNGEPFRLAAHGDPLFTADRDKPYTFQVDVQGGATHLGARARLLKPFDLAAVEADFSASGDDLADVYYLTGLALPNTAPYKLTAKVKRQGNDVDVTDLDSHFAKSDLSGKVHIDDNGARPVMTADIRSRSLALIDIAPTLGAPTKTARPGEGSLGKGAQRVGAGQRPTENAPATETKETVASTAAPSGLLLPDAKLQLDRVRRMDATVRYRAESVVADKIPIRHVDFTLHLQGGLLTLQPVSFTLPQGKIAGAVKIDARRDIPDVALDMRLDDIRLSQFHTRNSPPAIDGTLVGRLLLHGRGRSVHEAASTADGIVTMVIPHGDVREAFAELTGIDAARGLGLLLTRNQQETGIRCGIADFKAQRGVLDAQTIIFDTQNVLITGKGDVDLRSEKLDLSLYGRPKKMRLFRIKSPIGLAGTLRKPSIGIKAGNTPGQAALAVALGTLLTPVAAVLAFVDPGLAKNADCTALLQEGDEHGAPVKEASAEPNAQPTRVR